MVFYVGAIPCGCPVLIFIDIYRYSVDIQLIFDRYLIDIHCLFFFIFAGASL